MNMSNHPLSNEKTMFDLFNMLNPNCYQAFIIQYIIENRKEDALRCCDELEIAIQYYKWEVNKRQSSYIDSLICESQLEKWQKIAIIHIITNDVTQCKKEIENQLNAEKEAEDKRHNSAKEYVAKHNSFDDLCRIFGFDSIF